MKRLVLALLALSAPVFAQGPSPIDIPTFTAAQLTNFCSAESVILFDTGEAPVCSDNVLYPMTVEGIATFNNDVTVAGTLNASTTATTCTDGQLLLADTGALVCSDGTNPVVFVGPDYNSEYSLTGAYYIGLDNTSNANGWWGVNIAHRDQQGTPISAALRAAHQQDADGTTFSYGADIANSSVNATTVPDMWGARIGVNSEDTSVVTDMISLDVTYQVLDTSTVTTGRGVTIHPVKQGGATITDFANLSISNFSGSTSGNSAQILLGDTGLAPAIPTGDYAIYSASTDESSFAGPVTVAPVDLDGTTLFLNPTATATGTGTFLRPLRISASTVAGASYTSAIGIDNFVGPAAGTISANTVGLSNLTSSGGGPQNIAQVNWALPSAQDDYQLVLGTTTPAGSGDYAIYSASTDQSALLGTLQVGTDAYSFVNGMAVKSVASGAGVGVYFDHDMPDGVGIGTGLLVGAEVDSDHSSPTQLAAAEIVAKNDSTLAPTSGLYGIRAIADGGTSGSAFAAGVSALCSGTADYCVSLEARIPSLTIQDYVGLNVREDSTDVLDDWVGVLIGTDTVPDGDYAIYSASTDKSELAGSLHANVDDATANGAAVTATHFSADTSISQSTGINARAGVNGAGAAVTGAAKGVLGQCYAITGAVEECYGILAGLGVESGGGTIETSVGVGINEQTNGNTNVNLQIGNGLPVGGDYAIYSASTDPSVLSGGLTIADYLDLPPSATPPGGSVAGRVYYDSDLNLPCMYNGTDWVQMDDFSTVCS